MKHSGLMFPAVVLHAIDNAGRGAGRENEPWRTALNVIDRYWTGTGPAWIEQFARDEAVQLAAALAAVTEGKYERESTKLKARKLAGLVREHRGGWVQTELGGAK